jgi:vesicle-fusing ATPase
MDFTKEIKFDKKCPVEKIDFEAALKEVKPDFGVDEDKIGQRLRGEFHSYGPRFDELWKNTINAIHTFSKNNLGVSSLLLYGQGGSGKTSLACQLIKSSQIPYAKLLSSEDLIGKTDYGKIKTITDTFNNSPFSTPFSNFL